MAEEIDEAGVVALNEQVARDMQLLDLDVRRLMTHLRVLLLERKELLDEAEAWRKEKPIDLLLFCPNCKKQHLDVGEFRERVHRKHKCENTPEGEKTGCGHLWVPHWYATRGVTVLERALWARKEYEDCGGLIR